MDTKGKTSPLAGKKVVVVGGSSGLGLATAKAVTEEGARVVIASSNRQRVDAALAQLPANSKGHTLDVTNEIEIKAFFEAVGKFDHLVFTAGENISLSPIDSTEVAFARNYFSIRYWGAFLSVKYAHPFIQPGGSITLTSGIASARPGKGWSLGASICGAMEGFMRAMAVELAPIRVNIVSPGVVRTDLWNSMSAPDREALYTAVGQSLLVKRVGEPDEVAQTYLYLMKQPYSSGQVIVVDGGSVLV
ncbi:SDR family oxidoreductase [Chryseolinea lacunae]|uniref:SDR family oxidoreductase n=1 Tax=Chryseolinea lacunae TaxID=2801331 RepID=A0ABS1KMJ8_9BACT|nr:SDR family oxidoreductase [Chryseolinea lacunae]MBL0740443.1 SDR family oxidoreductase [Chryseolinea lacunae]